MPCEAPCLLRERPHDHGYKFSVGCTRLTVRSIALFADLHPLLPVLCHLILGSSNPNGLKSATAKFLHLLLVPCLGRGFTSSHNSNCFGIQLLSIQSMYPIHLRWCLLRITAMLSVIPKDSASSLDAILSFHCCSLDTSFIVLIQQL